MKYEITEEELRGLLSRSYDEGWSGYLDMKDSVTQKMIEEFLSERPKTKEKPVAPDILTIQDVNGNTWEAPNGNVSISFSASPGYEFMGENTILGSPRIYNTGE